MTYSNITQRCRQLRISSLLPISLIVSAELILSVVRLLDVHYRVRVYDPCVTLWLMLTQALHADPSSTQAVKRLNAFRASCGLSQISTDTSAFTQAKLRLPLQLFRLLTYHYAQLACQSCLPNLAVNTRRIVITDGTTFRLPDTPKLQAAYPQPTSHKPGLGFPRMRAVALFCWQSAVLLGIAYGPHDGKGNGETSLFAQLLDLLLPNDILLGDRNFDGYKLLAATRARQVDVVLRANASRVLTPPTPDCQDWQEVCHKPAFSTKRWTREEHDSCPESITVRIVRYLSRRAGFRTKRVTLVTTLLDKVAYPLEMLAGMYRERWQCEIHLRTLKVTLNLRSMRSKTPGGIERELWAGLLLYNALRYEMAQSVKEGMTKPRRLSFANVLQSVRARLSERGDALKGPGLAKRWHKSLRQEIATQVLSDRPDRSEPRKVKTSPRYAKMTQTRRQHRQAASEGQAD